MIVTFLKITALTWLIIGSFSSGLLQAQEDHHQTSDPFTAMALQRIIGDGLSLLHRAPAVIHGQTAFWATFAAPDREIQGLFLEDGSLLQIAERIHFESLPQSLKTIHANSEDADTIVAQVWLAAYAIEDNLADGTERERYFDPFGHLLCQFSEEDDEEGKEDEAAEEGSANDVMPEVVRHQLALLRGPEIVPREVEAEREWGVSAYEISWRDPGGRQEMKITSDGVFMAWEGPLPRKLPATIEQLGRGSEVERVLIRVFTIRKPGTDHETLALLATGQLLDISLAEAPAH